MPRNAAGASCHRSMTFLYTSQAARSAETAPLANGSLAFAPSPVEFFDGEHPSRGLDPATGHTVHRQRTPLHCPSEPGLLLASLPRVRLWLAFPCKASAGPLHAPNNRGPIRGGSHGGLCATPGGKGGNDRRCTGCSTGRLRGGVVSPPKVPGGADPAGASRGSTGREGRGRWAE